MPDFPSLSLLPHDPVIHTQSVECEIGVNRSAGAPASGVLTSGRVYYVPIRVSEPRVVREFLVHNGAAVSGNFDCGLYDYSLRKVISTGLTAQSGTSVPQWTSVTATPISPGFYYLAMMFDNGTSTVLQTGAAEGLVAELLGYAIQSSQSSLPSSATLAFGGTTAVIPLMGMFAPAVGSSFGYEALGVFSSINPASRYSSGPNVAAMTAAAGFGTTGSGAYPTANLAIAMPFTLPRTSRLRALGWLNGATVDGSGHVDVAVYSAGSLEKLASSGATTPSGTTAKQSVDVSASNINLPAGDYLLALWCDSTTQTFRRVTIHTAATLNANRWKQQPSVSTNLPATLVPADISNAYVPFAFAQFGRIL